MLIDFEKKYLSFLSKLIMLFREQVSLGKVEEKEEQLHFPQRGKFKHELESAKRLGIETIRSAVVKITNKA